MICTFLGTAAAQGLPPIHARNTFYQKVRCRPNEVRTRTGFRIGNKHQIDISPDISAQLNRLGMDMYSVEHLLLTHTHGDHFSPVDLFDCLLMASEESGSLNPVKPTLYLSKPAYIWLCSDWLNAYKRFFNEERWAKVNSLINIVPVDYYRDYQAGELSFFTVKSNHMALGEGEYAINYLVSNNDTSIFYASDTGFYKEDTWAQLKGRYANAVVMEATFTSSTTRGGHGDGHLNFQTFSDMLQRMAEIGFIDSKSVIYATHFNGAQQHFQAELENLVANMPFEVKIAQDCSSFVLR